MLGTTLGELLVANSCQLDCDAEGTLDGYAFELRWEAAEVVVIAGVADGG